MLQFHRRQAKEVSLGHVDADFQNMCLYFPGRDIFGDSADIVGFCDGDAGLHGHAHFRVGVELLDERAIDLYEIGGEIPKYAPVGIAGAEIVYGKLAAKSLQLLAKFQERLLFDVFRFGYLDSKTFGAIGITLHFLKEEVHLEFRVSNIVPPYIFG